MCVWARKSARKCEILFHLTNSVVSGEKLRGRQRRREQAPNTLQTALTRLVGRTNQQRMTTTLKKKFTTIRNKIDLFVVFKMSMSSRCQVGDELQGGPNAVYCNGAQPAMHSPREKPRKSSRSATDTDNNNYET